MITFTKAFVAEGKVYATLEEAQVAEITSILTGEWSSSTDVAKHIVKHADRIVDVLTTSQGSRPPARKINGGRKPRTKKDKAAQPDLLAPVEK